MSDRAAVAAAAAFAALTRAWAGAERVRSPGDVALPGADPWYHWRTATWTASSFPRLPGLDPYTAYPAGASPGQFGTAWDVLLAAAYLAGEPLGAGMLSASLVPPVVAAAAVPACWACARAAFGREAGLAAAAGAAALPGVYFSRGTLGFIDHHAIEIAFQTAAVALLAHSLTDRGGLRHGLAAGAALAAYVAVWPPGFYFLAIVAPSLGAAALWLYARGRAYRRPIEAAAVASAPLLLLVPAVYSGGSSPTRVGALHLAAPLCAALSMVGLDGALDRADRRGLPRRRVAAGIAVLAAAAAAAALAASPWALDKLSEFFLLRVFTAGQPDILEARGAGLVAGPAFLLSETGLVAAVAAASALALDPDEPSHWLIGAWAAASCLMALTQVRFAYYLAPAAAVLASLAAARAAGPLAAALEAPVGRGALAAALVVAAAVPAGGSVVAQAEEPRELAEWEGSLDWVRAETPAPGLEYRGDHGPPRDVLYPPGAYGVMTWWDKGHWVTAIAERPAVANPMQQHKGASASFFTSRSPAAAEAALGGLGMEGGERVRYVATSSWMLGEGARAMARSAPAGAAHGPTLAERLHARDGSGAHRYRLVHESRARSTVASVGGGDPERLRPPELEAARRTGAPVRVAYRGPAVKVFERVPGARVRGDAPRQSGSVTVSVRLRTNTGRLAVYSIEVGYSGGAWRTVVPYHTAEPRYRDSVRAVGPYRVTGPGGLVATFNVTPAEARGEGVVAA